MFSAGIQDKLYPRKEFGYVNIPFQSTFNKLLKLMKRTYRFEEVLEAVSGIREKERSVWLMKHINFGFPLKQTRNLKP